jgi:CHAD domain-containing protein
MRALAGSQPPALTLARHQKRRIPRLKQRLLRELRRLQVGQLSRIIEQWLTDRRDGAEERLRHRATLRLAAQKRWLARPTAARPTERALHKRRIRLKQVRYMAELAVAAGCPLPQGVDPGLLARLQTALGARTDIDMISRAIDRHARAHPRWAASADDLRNTLRSRRAALAPLPPLPRTARRTAHRRPPMGTSTY